MTETTVEPTGRIEPGALAAVLTTLPIDGPLDYRADGPLAVGSFVEVAIGPRRMLGVVWGEGEGRTPPEKIRAVDRVLDLPPMPAPMRDFLDRAADYTVTTPGLMLRLATRSPGLLDPPGPRIVYRDTGERPERMTAARARVIEVMEAHPGLGLTVGEIAGLAAVSTSVVKGLADAGALLASETPRDRPYPLLDPTQPRADLTPQQAEAATALQHSVAKGAYATTLLRGVTGSGKTEVYLEAVAECLRQGRQALVMLPEIALTTTFIERLTQRFGARPTEWHSGVPSTERRRAWSMVARGRAQVVVGARSALFLPYADLGLIVVDEEHDGAYKQEDGVCYHARDMAVLRASLNDAAVILASATPSLETWANADAGKYERLELPDRYGPAVLPTLRSLDLREHGPERGRWISPPLAQAVAARLAAGEQSLLFLNRRGYAPVILCQACGHRFACPHCDAHLVEHRFRSRIMCHQCGHTEKTPTACPKCERQDRLAACGPGVERLAEEAAERFPQARVTILSSDMAETAAALRERIDAIARGEADIIIGTQMVAKGHNFPLMTLVGAIDADLGLHGGDLRAAEKTFQLMRQVAGRAGRSDKPGEALLQTVAPDHPVIKAILSGDEETFWRREADQRRAAGAPPYGRMAGVILSGPDEAAVFRAAQDMARAADPLRAMGADVFGPALAPIGRIRGRTRVRLLVKAPKGLRLSPALASWRASVKTPGAIRVTIDVDPQSFL